MVNASAKWKGRNRAQSPSGVVHLFYNLTANPMKLFHFDDIRIHWDQVQGELYRADWWPIHIFIPINTSEWINSTLGFLIHRYLLKKEIQVLWQIGHIPHISQCEIPTRTSLLSVHSVNLPLAGVRTTTIQAKVSLKKLFCKEATAQATWDKFQNST